MIAGKHEGTEGSSWEEHVTGYARYASEEAAQLDLGTIRAACNRKTQEFDSSWEDNHLDFGPRWKNVKRIEFGDTEALVHLELPEEFAGDLSQYHLHPSLMDMATASAQSLIPGIHAR